MFSRIIVATLSWNGLDKLKNLRPGLLRNLDATALPYDWFIRSNGCKDNTVEEIKAWSEVSPLLASHNRDNFAQGVNSLVSLAVNKYGKEEIDNSVILLLNNDIEFKDEVSLLNMLNIFKDKDVAQVGARLMFPEGNICHAGVIFSQRYGMMPWHWRDREAATEAAKRNYEFQAVTAAVSFVRGKDFFEAGCLPEQMFWAFEDTWLSLSLKEKGKKIVCCGQTEISHLQSATLRKNPQNKVFMQHNVKTFKERWFGKYEIDHDRYLNDPDYNLYENT